MEKFKISDIQEMFVSDVERFHNLTQQNVRDLLDAATPSQESLDEALRQCHTLKGLAGSVEAWGLSCLGSDFERLLELAGSWMGTERERANQIFEFILEHLQDWYVMNQFSCMEMLPQAWDIYQGLRVLMEDRWPGCLPPLGAQAGMELAAAQYVRLPDLQIAEPTAVPETAAAPTTPPPSEVVTAERDVQGASPVSPPAEAAPMETTGSAEGTSTKAPLPVRVVPPVLRHRESAATPAAGSKAADSTTTGNLQATSGEVATPTDSAASELPPATGASAASTEKVGPTPAASTPPLLRVAPPTLKRRGQPAAPAPEGTSAPAANQSAASTPTKPEAEAAEAMSAEALFASLPESAEVEAAAPAVTESAATVESAPGADNDLLVMLSQEVAGYLNELTERLLELAGNLAAKEPWNQTRRLFHTIKGTAATFGLDAVSGPAKAAEVRCVTAIEKVRTRTRKSYEDCVHRAGVIAKALSLPFDEGRLREALERGLAEAANAAAAASAPAAAASGLDPEMAGFFINDARDQIAVIEQAVLRWEKGEQPGAQVQAAQRGFHTIKGAGNSIGLTAVAASVHQVESFLETVAAKGASGSKAVFTFLLGAVDQLRGYLDELARNPAAVWRPDWTGALLLLATSGEAESQAQAPAAAAALAAAMPEERKEAAVETSEGNYLRIETSRLHQLMDLIGELVMDRTRLARKIEQLAELHRALGERNGALSGSVQKFQEQFEFNLKSQVAGAGGPGPVPTSPGSAGIEGRAAEPAPREPGQAATGFSELEFDRYDRFNELARSLVEVSHDIAALNAEVTESLERLAAEHETVAATSRALQGRVAGLSLVPVRELFPRLERAFRDALSVSGKQAGLEFAGGEGLLDKAVVDRVYGPLLHLVRNAVAHGVETAERRRELKKTERGQVRLSARQEANQFVLELSDDGSGVDAVAVRARAVARGWLAEGAPELTAEQVTEFIFRPGFSTAGSVSSVAGRGVGLDVVRREVENLNGSVELRWVAGQGTTWRLRLPLTLSVSEAVLAVVGSGSSALPESIAQGGSPGNGETTQATGAPATSVAAAPAGPGVEHAETQSDAPRSALRAPVADVSSGVVFAFPLNFVESGLILEEATRRSESGVELYPVARRWTNSDVETPSSDNPASTPAIASPDAPSSAVATPEADSAEAELEWLPVLRLSQLFGLAGRADSNKGLVISVGERRMVVVVDAVLSRQEIVVKPLDAVMSKHPLLNGASLDPEGRVIPILNLPALLQSGEAVRGNTPVAPTPASRPNVVAQSRVLVVDDSLSVRKVQARFLRDLGCAVTVASDGLAALERLREADFDFIFTDLEMPRLNGYELISEVRGNPAWSHVPVAVISSRGADKYITKAMNLGACTFLTKPFTQEQLRQVLTHFGRTPAGNSETAKP